MPFDGGSQRVTEGSGSLYLDITFLNCRNKKALGGSERFCVVTRWRGLADPRVANMCRRVNCQRCKAASAGKVNESR